MHTLSYKPIRKDIQSWIKKFKKILKKKNRNIFKKRHNFKIIENTIKNSIIDMTMYKEN